jgi:hypothetical protein
MHGNSVVVTQIFELLFMIGVWLDSIAQSPARTNFPMVCADDLGGQDPRVYDNQETHVMGGFGGTNVFDALHMDARTAEGMLFRQACSSVCACVLRRAALFSGQTPARLNFTAVAGESISPQSLSVNSRMMEACYNRRLKVKETTLTELLRTKNWLYRHLEEPGPLGHEFHYSNGDRGVTFMMPGLKALPTDARRAVPVSAG